MYGKKALTLVLAVAMLLSTAFAGGAAAWSGSSEIDSTTDMVEVDTNSDGSVTVAVNETAAGNASDLELIVTGADPVTMQPLDVSLYSASGASASGGEYIFNIPESELGDAPKDSVAGAIDIRVYDVAAEQELEATTIHIDDTGSNNTVTYVGDVGADSPTETGVVSDSVGVSTASVGGFLGFGASDVDKLEANGFTNVDDNASIEMRFAETSASALADAANDSESGSVAPVSMSVNNAPILVFTDEAPDYMSDHTHAVYDSETGDVVVELADDADTSSDVTYDIETHNTPSFGVLSDQMGKINAITEILPF